jgi:NAD(P)-dependent dehydrogenase (short-subunit alcohol dehydrogenase family)
MTSERMMAMHDFTPRRVLLALVAVCSLVGCGGSDSNVVAPSTSPPADFAAEASDFDCILDWNEVRHFRITNKVGLLDEALAVANDPQPGRGVSGRDDHPALSGRGDGQARPDFDPSNHNWEYFELRASEAGTEIHVRGRDDVIKHVRRAVLRLPQCRAGFRLHLRGEPRLHRSPDRSGRDPRPAARPILAASRRIAAESEMGRLDGKVAVITGAASGIGAATALQFAREGAALVLADLNTEGGEHVAAECRAAGARAVFQRCDVAEEGDVTALIARADREHGGLHVLFNNAGLGGALGPIEQTDVADWDSSVAVLLRSVFLGMKHGIPLMRKSGGGSIISTASVAGLRGGAGPHAYSAAKAAVVNLTRSVALEVAKDSIRVNCICPGGINTPLISAASAARS